MLYFEITRASMLMSKIPSYRDILELLNTVLFSVLHAVLMKI